MGNNEWQDKLRAGMEGFSEPVPDSVWNAVSSGVTGVWDRQRRAARRRRFFAASSAFAAAVLAAVLVLPGGSGQRASLTASDAGLLASVPDLQEAERLFAIPDPAGLDDPRRQLRSGEASSLPVPGDMSSAPGSFGNGPEANMKEMPAADASAPADVPEPERQYAGQPSADTYSGLPAVFPESYDERGRRPRVSLNFRASNLASGSSESLGYGGMYGSVVAPALSSQRDQVNSYSSVLLGNNSREVSTNTRHWQPVSLGVSASLDINDFLAFETGLTYSCLISDMSSGTEENRYDIRQTLHYVGIPFRARLSVWKPGNLELYLSAGAEVEKCVYGTSSTTYVVNSSAASHAAARVFDDKLQWSAGASAGLGYRFNDFLGIYAEPGISWYFSNGGFVENVYRDRPFNFSIALGLRFYIDRD